jgi:hypothetical protein
MNDLVKILLTTLVSLPTGYLLSVLTNDRKHRGEAWTKWNSVNQALRTKDGPPEVLQHALGEAEWALRYGRVPDELYRALEVSTWGYWNYWRVFPHGNPAPTSIILAHQRTVDELRLILQHPIRSKLRRRPDYRIHRAFVESLFDQFTEMYLGLAALAAQPEMADKAIDAASGRVTPEYAAEVMRQFSEQAQEAAEEAAEQAEDETTLGI